MKNSLIESLGDLFDNAAQRHCSEGDSCYVGTCPVNCLVPLVSVHLKYRLFFMLYGDCMVLKRLAKCC